MRAFRRQLSLEAAAIAVRSLGASWRRRSRLSSDQIDRRRVEVAVGRGGSVRCPAYGLARRSSTDVRLTCD